MKPRERTRAFHLALLFVGALVFTGLLFLIFSNLRNLNREKSLNPFFNKLDGLIEQGTLQEALAAIKSFDAEPTTAAGWIRFLKRVKIVTGKTGTPEVFAAAAEKASTAFPGNEMLRSLAVLGFLEAGDSKKAGAWAEKYLKSRAFESVKAEAFLRSGLVPDAKVSPEAEMILTTLGKDKNPEDFLKAGSLTGVKEFYLDAALLLLRRGELEKARQTFSAQGLSDFFPLVAALAAYDEKDYKETERILSSPSSVEINNPERLLLLADLHLRQKQFTAAEIDYAFLCSTYPYFLPLPFLNGAALEQRKKAWSGLATLEAGYRRFPERRETVFALAKMYTALGKGKTAIALAEGFDKYGPKSADTLLIKTLTNRETFSAARLIGELWMLRDVYPDHDGLRRILSWLLLGVNDSAAIADIVSRENASAWDDFYLGILAYRKKDFRSASEAFERSFRKAETPEAAYNKGIVSYELKDLGQALSSFRKCSDMLLGFQAKASSFGVKTRLSIALTLQALGRLSEAKKELQSLLVENPKHAETLRILRKLEGTP